MGRIWQLVKAHPKVAVIAALVLLALFWYLAGSISQSWHSDEVNKQDAELQKTVDADSKHAQDSEANANSSDASRINAEGRAAKADEDRQQAAINSNRSLESVTKARKQYDQARHSRPADAPVLTDDQLCAELAKRGIACR